MLAIDPSQQKPGGAISPISMPAGGGQSPIAMPLANNPLVPANSTAPNANPVTVPAGISNGINTADGSYTLTGDFKDTYGAGTGSALAGVLGNLGTATDGAVTATNAAIEANAAKGFANIGSSQAAAGISPNSSTAALASGDFYAGVNQNIASTDAQMQLQQQDTLINSLQREGDSHGPDVGAMATLAAMFPQGLVGSMAGALAGGSQALNDSGASGSGGFSSSLSTITDMASMFA